MDTSTVRSTTYPVWSRAAAHVSDPAADRWPRTEPSDDAAVICLVTDKAQRPSGSLREAGRSSSLPTSTSTSTLFLATRLSTAFEPPLRSANEAAGHSGQCDSEELPVAADPLEEVHAAVLEGDVAAGG
jgi:hypothetical protein